MVNIQISKLEKLLGKKIKKNIVSVGIDTASRTGWARADVGAKSVTIDYGFIDIKSKDIYYRYNMMIEQFDSIIHNANVVVIEDVFLKFNVKVLSFLARIGMIVYVLAQLKKIPTKYFIWASTARKNIGINGIGKKEDVQNEFRKKYNIEVTDNDIVDAIVLALNGIIETPELG